MSDMEFYKVLIDKLENVKVYEDNYSLCSAAAGAIRELISKLQAQKNDN